MLHLLRQVRVAQNGAGGAYYELQFSIIQIRVQIQYMIKFKRGEELDVRL